MLIFQQAIQSVFGTLFISGGVAGSTIMKDTGGIMHNAQYVLPYIGVKAPHNTLCALANIVHLVTTCALAYTIGSMGRAQLV